MLTCGACKHLKDLESKLQWKSRLAARNNTGQGLAGGNAAEYTANKLDVFPPESC